MRTPSTKSMQQIKEVLSADILMYPSNWPIIENKFRALSKAQLNYLAKVGNLILSMLAKKVLVERVKIK